MPPAKKTAKRGMSAEHKAALAEGREQGRAIRVYLEALEAHKPRRGRKRTPESIKKRLAAIGALLGDADPLTRLNLIQEQSNLQAELANMGRKVNMSDLEAEFVRHASAYAERRGIEADTWRRMGVVPAVLKRAGIKG